MTNCRNEIGDTIAAEKQPYSFSSSNKTKKARTMAVLINKKLWSSELESALATVSQPSISKTTVLQVLRLVKGTSKALQFFNWVHRFGFVHSRESYFLMLELLGKAENLNAARNFLFSIPRRSNNVIRLDDKLFNSLIRSYGKAGLFQESLKLFKTMKTIGTVPSVFTFNTLFSLLLKRGRTGMAYDLYEEMLKTFGVKPDIYTFNILIRGFCRNSMVDEGFRLFKEMDRFKCDPDLVTYNTIIDGLCRVGKVDIAHNVFKGMLKRSGKLTPNLVTYTTLIRGYCEKQVIEKALEVFYEMIDQGLRPNTITYNTLIQGLCAAQKLDKIKKILEEIVQDEGFTPDTCTFNTLINAHCKVENLDQAFKIYEKMSDLKVQPDFATYSILIRCLCEQNEFERAEKLFDELLQKKNLSHDTGSAPVVAGFNPMFEHLCSNGKTKKAERVFRVLTRRGKQDPVAYRTLILGHCKENSFQDGHKFLILMLRRDFVPDVEIYDSLIEGFLKIGEGNLAYDTLGRMLRSSYVPKASTFHRILQELVRKDCASECASLIKLMLEKNIRQDINLSTDAIWILFRAGLADMAFEVAGSLYEKGFMVNINKLLIVLCRSKKISDASQLLQFSLKKNQIISKETCSLLLSLLCKAQKASEAFVVFYDLLEHGLQLPSGSMEELKAALKSEKRYKEAAFVSKRTHSQLQLDGSSSKRITRW